MLINKRKLSNYNIIDRIKLLMGYDESNTLSENEKIILQKNIILEQKNTKKWNSDWACLVNKKDKNAFYYEEKKIGGSSTGNGISFPDGKGGVFELYPDSNTIQWKKQSPLYPTQKSTYKCENGKIILTSKWEKTGYAPKGVNPNEEPVKTSDIVNLNELEVIGPFVYDESNEKYDVKYKDGIILVGKYGTGDAYYIIKNNTKNNLTILSANSSNPNKIVSVVNPGILKPKETKKLYISINDIPIEEKKKEIPNISISSDNTYLPKKPESIKNNPVQTNIITIKTNLLTKEIKVNFDYSQAQKQIDKIILNSTKRISPKGYKVAKYFSVFEYDDFISQFETINCTGKPFTKCLEELKKGTAWSPDELNSKITSMGQTLSLSGYWSCYQQYKKLYEKYYDEHFPNGIHSEDKEEFYEKINELNNKTKEIENQLSQIKYNDNITKDELLRQSKVIDLKSEELYNEYGYDARGSFDKFMDSGFGHIAQIGSFVVLMIAGFYTGGATWSVVAELGLNIGLGTYYLNRGNTREALTWFIFAGLGKLHTLYNAVSNSVGRKIFKESLESVSKGIAKALEGVSLSTKEELFAFMYTNLTRNQRIVFREVLNQIKNGDVVKESLEAYAKEIAQARGVWTGLGWNEAMKLLPKATKFFRNTIIDLTATLPLVHSLYDKIKEGFKNCGIDITWGERDSKLLEELAKKQSPEEIKRIFSYIDSVKNKLTEPERAYYSEELNKIKSTQELEDLKNKTEEDAKKDAERIKQNLDKASKEHTDFAKKYYEGSPELLKKWEITYKNHSITAKKINGEIEKDYTDEQFLNFLKNKEYKNGDRLEYWGNNSEILKIYNSDIFEDIPETKVNDKKPKQL